MKKVLLALFLALTGTAYAQDPASVNRSSFTKTNDSAYIAASYLDVITVSSGTAGGVLKVYNSTYTTSGQILEVNLGVVQNIFLDALAVKGIFYVTTSNTNGVSIIYKK